MLLDPQTSESLWFQLDVNQKYEQDVEDSELQPGERAWKWFANPLTGFLSIQKAHTYTICFFNLADVAQDSETKQT